MSDDIFFVSEGPALAGHGPLLRIKDAGYMAFATRPLSEAFISFAGLAQVNHVAAASELSLEALPPVVRAAVLRTPQEVDAMMADRTGFPYAEHVVDYHRPAPPPAAASV